MSSSHNALFGDDDDDSSEASTDKKRTAVSSQPAKSTSRVVKDDDDEDDADEGKKKKDKVGSVAENKSQQRKGIFADSEEEEDDDVEFDDKGAVVGLAPAQTKTRVNNNDRGKDIASQENEGEQEEGVEGESMASSPRRKKQQQRVIDTRPLTLPHMKLPDFNDISIHITKLPNLIGIKTTAFDPDDYHPTIEEEDFGPSAVHNLVRWRYKTDATTGHKIRDENGRLIRESNTRIVEWEDGSWTLHVGEETFELENKNTATPDGFSALNGYLYLSQPATVSEQEQTEEQDGNQMPAGTVLEGFGPISSRMIARPSSLQSEAHKSLTLAVRQRTIKKAKIAEIATAEDPEKLKQDRIRIKSDLEKAATLKSGARRGNAAGRRPRMSRGYLERGDSMDEDDYYNNEDRYDNYDIGGTKRRMRDRDTANDDDIEEEEDEVDLEKDGTFNAKRPTKRLRKSVKDEEDDIVLPDDDDDDDDDEADAPRARAKPSKKPAHRAVLDDDEDSD